MIKTISTIDGDVVVEEESFSEEQIASILRNATKAFQKAPPNSVVHSNQDLSQIP